MATDTQFSELKEATGPLRPGEGMRAHSEQESISLLDFLIVLAERRRTVFLVTAVFAILAIIISLLMPKTYTASVLLMPPQQNSSIGSVLASQLGNLGSMAALAGGSLGLKNPNDMYVAMFRSDTVEDAMVRDFGLEKEYHSKLLSEARHVFQARSTVDGTSKDGLLHISVSDGDPQRAADLANGYVNEFRHLTEHLAITEAGQRRLFFQQQLEQAKDKLADAEEALKQTEQSTGMIQLDSQARALIESAASLRAQITAKEVQLQAMRTYATGENSQLIEAEQELEGLRAQLAKLGGSEDSPDSLIVPKGKVPEFGLEYVRKLRDVKYYETIFEILARQFEMAKLDEAKEGAIVQVVDPAIKPDRRSSPKRALIVICATAAGLVVGIFLALLQAAWRRMKENPDSNAKLSLLRSTIRNKSRLPPEPS